MIEKYSKSLYWISYLTGIKINYLKRIIYNKREYYQRYTIRKKKKYRLISEPNSSLKYIQRKILNKILYACYSSHNSSMAYQKRQTIVFNAKPHISKRIVLKLDLKDFFPSIKKDRIYSFFRRRFNEQVSEVLSELCTFGGELPQGAPTSPAISNFICYDLDKRLDCLSARYNLNYTRYSDDLTFSGKEINRNFLKNVKMILNDEGFNLNEQKIRWMTPNKPQIVTGIFVNNKISFGRKKYKDLCALINNCCKGDLVSEKEKAISKGLKIKNLKKYLYGKTAYLKSIDLDKAEKLKKKLDSIKGWVDYEEYERQNTKRDVQLDFLNIIQRINSKFSTNMFHEDFSLPVILIKQIQNENDFNTFCLRLAIIFNNMNVKLIDQKLNNSEQINQLEEWLNKNNYEGERILISIRDLIKLSNYFERHKKPEEIDKIFRKYSQKLTNPDYESFKIILIKKITDSLNQIDRAIKDNL